MFGFCKWWRRSLLGTHFEGERKGIMREIREMFWLEVGWNVIHRERVRQLKRMRELVKTKKNRYNCPLGLEYLRTPCTFSHFAGGGGDGLSDSQQLIMFITPRFGVLFINKNWHSLQSGSSSSGKWLSYFGRLISQSGRQPVRDTLFLVWVSCLQPNLFFIFFICQFISMCSLMYFFLLFFSSP